MRNKSNDKNHFFSLPPTNNFDPLGISFTASSAVEQNTGLNNEEDVEKKRCLSVQFCLLRGPDTYRFKIII